MEKYKKITYIGISAAAIFGMFYLFFHYVAFIVFPFAFSLLVVALARPTINKICVRTKLNKSAVGIVVITIMFTAFVLAGIFFASAVLMQLKSVVLKITDHLSREQNYLSDLFSFVSGIREKLPFLRNGIPDGIDIYSVAIDALKSALGGISAHITAFAAGFVSSLPTFIITAVVTVMALFYFAKDYDRIGEYVIKTLPKKISSKIPTIKKDVVSVISKYIKSHLILLVLTFVELFCGFLFLGIENPFALAVITALVDILPVLGTGCVLVPWSIILFIGGNSKLGIGIIVLYLVVYLLRQIEEPRIISSQMNVHPLVTLLAMYAGLKISGVFGMIFAPFAAFVIKTVAESIKKEKNIEK